MANKINLTSERRKHALTAMLLSTMAFCLSSLPGQINTPYPVSITDMSSGNCDYRAQLEENGKSAECNTIDSMNSMKVTSNVKVTVDEAKPDKLNNTPRSGKVLTVTITSETDCEECMEGKQRTHTTFTRNAQDIAALNAAITEARQKNAKIVVSATETARIAKKAQQDCKINDQGKPIAKDDVLTCYINQLDNLRADEFGAYYFQHIEPELEALLTSDDTSDQKKGMRLLKELGRSTHRGNAKVSKSIRDLTNLGKVKLEATELEARIAKLPKGDPNRKALIAQLNQLELRSKNIIASRKLQYQKSKFDYDGRLLSNLESYSQHLEARFADINKTIGEISKIGAEHNARISGTPSAAAVAAAQGRAARFTGTPGVPARSGVRAAGTVATGNSIGVPALGAAVGGGTVQPVARPVTRPATTTSRR